MMSENESVRNETGDVASGAKGEVVGTGAVPSGEEGEKGAAAEGGVALPAFEAEVIEANNALAGFCRLLSSIYLFELTEDQIERFAHARFDNDGSVMAQGYQLIHEYLRHRNTATRQELAVDYAHTFLGAGVYTEIMAPPYESVFTSKQRLLMQVSRDGALKYYRSEMVEVSDERNKNTPEDHLGFELQFMALLADRASHALEGGCTECFADLVKKMRSFYRFHQENWLEDYCDAIDKYCRTDFYRGISLLTRGYLESTRAYLDDLADAFGIDPEDVELRPAWADEDNAYDAKMAVEGKGFTESVFNKVKKEARELGAALPRNE